MKRDLLRRRWPALVLVVIALIAALAWGAGQRGEGPGEPTITRGDTRGAQENASASAGTSTGARASTGTGSSDDVIVAVPIQDLPRQVRMVVATIERGGPYDHHQDDTVFRNREGILPNKPRGFYREYTVRTPGESDRGARRIVRGRDGTMYYTDDHYRSFVRIRQ